MTRRIIAGFFTLTLVLSATAASVVSRAAPPDQSSLVTLSVVGTSDLHGAAMPRDGAGGLPLLAGYVNNLRRARAMDGGAVLLVDSGDTFQGDIESNLSEGAFVIDAYNALSYTAKAIGNHDFDFGSIDLPSGRQGAGDLRGALKARAEQARFPFLAANLIDDATGRPVDWPNVRTSTIVQAAGAKVGIIGVTTVDALRSTLAANVQGLHMAPLAPAIAAEASRLRAEGADIVIVAAHAGGRCERFDDPADLSSCDPNGEIFRAANELPRGLVNVIAAGHTHAGLAHQVNGIAIVEPYLRGQAFGRADIVFNRMTRSVTEVHLFPPRAVVAADEYEGRAVTPDPAILQAMTPGLEAVHRLQATPLGATTEAAIVRQGDLSSPLGNVFADAIRRVASGADVGIINNAFRGLWSDLPQGSLTFGNLYAVFPFDNRVARVTLTGGELGRWLAGEIRQGRRGALGVSGVTVRTLCGSDGLHVELVRAGTPVRDDERLVVVTIGGPTLSGNVATADPLAGGPAENGPVVLEAVADWLRGHGGVAAHDVENLASVDALGMASPCPLAQNELLNLPR
jgi:5'-nucleotidase